MRNDQSIKGRYSVARTLAELILLVHVVSLSSVTQHI
jgi:hypothetical protein